MDYMLDEPDDVECRDCGSVVPAARAKTVDDAPVCGSCFELYNPDLD